MKNLEARTEIYEKRLSDLDKALRKNADPSVVAKVLRDHYFALARECMEGYTPRPDLRDYWFKFYKGFNALVTKFEKIEESK